MKRSSANFYRTILFLVFVVGLILLIKSIDTYIFTQSFELLSFLTPLLFLSVGVWGSKKLTQLKK